MKGYSDIEIPFWNHLDIVNNDGSQKADIFLPDTSCEMRLGKLMGNLIHNKLKVFLGKYFLS